MNILCKFIYGILLLRTCRAFTSATIAPVKHVHFKGKSLIVTCNTTSLVKYPVLVYHYKNHRYKIPQISNDNVYNYIGNLTITEPDQSKVNVLCLENITDDLLGAKIYLFGYSPEMVLKGKSTPQLSCQDFNLRRIICCLKPNENEIVQLTGLVEDISEPLKIYLYNLQSGERETQFNKTCFNITQEVFVQTLNLNLSISNVLGSHNYTFSFERTEIMKPEAPNVILVAVNKSVIKMEIRLIDDGEFEIIGFCSSNSPKNITKHISRNITKLTTKIQLDKWIPYSIVSCVLRSRILFGSDPQGKSSEPGTSNVLQMPESQPNKGPNACSAFMIFDSMSFDGYLENIILYFQDVSQYDQNGIIISYKWKCDDCFIDKERMSIADEKISSDSRSVKLYRAKINSSFMITACTKVGCSDAWTTMSFKNLSVAKIRPRIYLVHRNDNIMKLFWYLDEEVLRISGQGYVFICYSTTNECSSTQLIKLDYSPNGSKSFTIQGRTPIKFAYIQSLNDSKSTKLKWFECINKISSQYEIEKKLSTLTSSEYISHSDSHSESKLFSPVIKLKVKIPPCHKFDVAIFSGINIVYNEFRESGIQNVSREFLSHEEIEFTLRNFTNHQTYKLKISIITSEGVLVHWMSYSISTYWLTVTYLILILIAVGSLLVCAGFIVGFLYKKWFNQYFMKKYKPPMHKMISNRINVGKKRNGQPLKLNNVDQAAEIIKYEPVSYSVSNSSSQIIQQSTSETRISETSGTSDYSNTDSKNNETDFTNNSYKPRPAPNCGITDFTDSYIERPNNSNLEEMYADLVIVEQKDKFQIFMSDGSATLNCGV